MAQHARFECAYFFEGQAGSQLTFLAVAEDLGQIDYCWSIDNRSPCLAHWHGDSSDKKNNIPVVFGTLADSGSVPLVPEVELEAIMVIDERASAFDGQSTAFAWNHSKSAVGTCLHQSSSPALHSTLMEFMSVEPPARVTAAATLVGTTSQSRRILVSLSPQNRGILC